MIEMRVQGSQCRGRILHFREVMDRKPMEDPRKGWPPLVFEDPGMEVRSGEAGWQLRCRVRKRWVALEPEEWVRQHIVAALVDSGWPLGRMVLEHPVRFGQVAGRIDIAVFDRAGNVELAVEVKAPQVPLNVGVADQLGRYDLAVSASALMISNGLRTAVWQRDAEGRWEQSKAWPMPKGR